MNFQKHMVFIIRYTKLEFMVKKIYSWCSEVHYILFPTALVESVQLAQLRCDNVVTKSLLTLSQRCDTVENESCADVGFRRSDNVALRRYQDVAITLLQCRHNI